MDQFPDFVYRREGPAAIWIDRCFAEDELLGLLKDPDALFKRSDAEIIKDQRKIRVARVPVTVAGQSKRVYVKRFNIFSWRYRLGSVFMASGAVRALRGAQVLSRENIPSARTVAAVEFRSYGMVSKSFFLTEEIVGGKTADAYWREELQSATNAGAQGRRRRFLRRLAFLFRRLHELNIYHNDLKDANILVVPSDNGEQESIVLLDLEGIRRYPKLKRRRKIKNLVQLNRTLGRYIRRSEKYLFLKYYVEENVADRIETRRWLVEINRRSVRLDRQKLRQAFWRRPQEHVW